MTLPLETGNGKVYQFPPDNAFLTEYGLAFCELFDLTKIPFEDILEVASHIVNQEKIEQIKKEGLPKIFYDLSKKTS